MARTTKSTLTPPTALEDLKTFLNKFSTHLTSTKDSTLRESTLDLTSTESKSVPVTSKDAQQSDPMSLKSLSLPSSEFLLLELLNTISILTDALSASAGTMPTQELALLSRNTKFN
jgi:hypothetical protein